MKEGAFSTFCRFCFARCPIKVIVEKGRVVKVERDAGDSSGFVCAKGLSLPEILNHPDRLRYPLRREGERGEGRWRRISWDEALELVAEKLARIRDNFGPEQVALAVGDPKGLEMAMAQRFASAFGTPNVMTAGHLCHVPTELASIYTFGLPTAADLRNPPKLLIIWGNNFPHTRNRIRLEEYKKLMDQTKIAVIDPRRTLPASKASLWLKPRPGADGILALGLIKAMVEERLYDEKFVKEYCSGFEKLEEEIGSFDREEIERISWVPWREIQKLAELYAESKPAAVEVGNALDQNPHSFQALRAICIFCALAGNIDIPGGQRLVYPPPVLRPGRFILLREFPRSPEKHVLSLPLARRTAFIPRQALIKAVLEGKPFPIRALLCFGTNPLITYPDSSKVFEALKKLELLVVADLFMTPTAALADIVLPAAGNCEFDEIAPYPPFQGFVLAYPKLVDPPGECRSDTWIINNLASKLGLGAYFWREEREVCDHILAPAGLSFEEFKERRILEGERSFGRARAEGFQTPSRKVEIFSKQLEDMGVDPIPSFGKLSRLDPADEEFPLLLTSAKEFPFVHSAFRNVGRLRALKAEPTVRLHPSAAARLNLREGEWVWIETREGRIKQKLELDPDLDPRVAVASYGWWFPEEGDLFGWSESNINILTQSENFEASLGSVQLRGIPCRIRRIEN